MDHGAGEHDVGALRRQARHLPAAGERQGPQALDDAADRGAIEHGFLDPPTVEIRQAMDNPGQDDGGAAHPDVGDPGRARRRAFQDRGNAGGDLGGEEIIDRFAASLQVGTRNSLMAKTERLRMMPTAT